MNKALDLKSISDLVKLFLSEEQKTIYALKKEKTNITKVISQITKRIKNKNSRVIYVGAGTSGRLGILDAAECKPTFNTDKFKAIIAGGNVAMFKTKEGVEDNTRQGLKDLKKLNPAKDDVVIGISASGETPYTLSALQYAKRCKALTIAITSSSKSSLSKTAHLSIAPDIKDEIILGSSRLKSGTAQKLILNMISSISMIKSTKVYENHMIDVVPANKKLIKRSIGIISYICNIGLNKAKSLFYKARKNTKAAIVIYFKKCNLKQATKLLKVADYNLRKII